MAYERKTVRIVSDGSVLGTKVLTSTGEDITRELCITQVAVSLDCAGDDPFARVQLTMQGVALDIEGVLESVAGTKPV